MSETNCQNLIELYKNLLSNKANFDNSLKELNKDNIKKLKKLPGLIISSINEIKDISSKFELVSDVNEYVFNLLMETEINFGEYLYTDTYDIDKKIKCENNSTIVLDFSKDTHWLLNEDYNFSFYSYLHADLVSIDKIIRDNKVERIKKFKTRPLTDQEIRIINIIKNWGNEFFDNKEDEKLVIDLFKKDSDTFQGVCLSIYAKEPLQGIEKNAIFYLIKQSQIIK